MMKKVKFGERNIYFYKFFDEDGFNDMIFGDLEYIKILDFRFLFKRF